MRKSYGGLEYIPSVQMEEEHTSKGLRCTSCSNVFINTPHASLVAIEYKKLKPRAKQYASSAAHLPEEALGAGSGGDK